MLRRIRAVFPCVFLLAFGTACKEAQPTTLAPPPDAGTIPDRFPCTLIGNCECYDDSDCTAPKVCAENSCEPPPCTGNGDCRPGTMCIDKTCVARNSDGRWTCHIVTRSQPIKTGATIELEAIVLHESGVALPGLTIEWKSSDETVVSISGSTATGGPNSGVARISAKVLERPVVECSDLELANFPIVDALVARVLVLDEETLRPIQNAEVTLAGAMVMSARTNVTGSASFQTAVVRWVTAVAAGYHSVSVLSPGANDLLLLLPKEPVPERAGGFRGKVSVSSARREDISIAVAGFARRMNILDYQISPRPVDIIPTEINAPELGLNNHLIDLPGNYLLGLGTKQFAAGNERCLGDAPGETELGCYVVAAPPGRTAAYVFGGYLKLREITPIANQLVEVLEEPDHDTAYRKLLRVMSPLIPRLLHGVQPLLPIDEYPVGPDGKADFSTYSVVDMQAWYEVNIHSIVSVRDMPQDSSNNCPEATLLTVYSIAGGRGLVPLGLRVVTDVEADEAPNCRVARTERPFGDRSYDTEEGEIPISVANLHSGLQGTDLLFAATAHDLEVDPLLPSQLSTVFKRSPHFQVEDSIDEDFLPFPSGLLSRPEARFETMEPTQLSSVTGVRLEIKSGARTWLVYAPTGSIELPDVAALRMLLASSDAAVARTFRADATYSELFSFGSGKTLDRSTEVIRAIAAEDARLSPP